MRWCRPSPVICRRTGGASTVRKAPSAARLVGWVTAAVFINYIDRGNLATAAPLMQDELNLSASQLGILLSAFYYGYVICMPAMGWLAERYGAKRVLGAGVAIWSIATLTTGFAGGFATLLMLRVLLGIGESVAFPCASKVLAHAVEVGRLGVANGILSFGYLLGPAVGTLLGGYLMTVFGWRAVFIVFGAMSLVWLWPWSRVPIGPPTTPKLSAADARPSFSQILRRRELWGASLGHFASNYGYYFIVSWLPFYLVKSRGFSMGSMVAIASWAYLLNALSALAMGWLADRWIRAGTRLMMIAIHVGSVSVRWGNNDIRGSPPHATSWLVRRAAGSHRCARQSCACAGEAHDQDLAECITSLHGLRADATDRGAYRGIARRGRRGEYDQGLRAGRRLKSRS